MSKYRVLYDLSKAHQSHGMTGIPQDTRFTFYALSHSHQFNLGGLLFREHGVYTGPSLNTILGQALFLGFFLYDKNQRTEKIVDKIIVKLISQRRKDLLEKAYHSLFPKKYFEIYPFLDQMEFSQIWRSLFHPFFPGDDMMLLSKAKYYLTPLGGVNLTQQRRLNTTGFDFVIFQEFSFTKISKGSTKIIRFHDGLPIFAADTFLDSSGTTSRMKGIIKCEQDTVFVCNSPYSLEALAKISPLAAEDAVVIPCTLPQMKRSKVTKDILMSIAAMRISPSTSSAVSAQDNIQKWFYQDNTTHTIPKFVMTLSSLQPGKNHLLLFRAWQKLRFETGEDIKLIVVGTPGWVYESILQEMQPMVTAGNLLHLEKVSQTELPYLYSAATLFILPSVTEGFGMPPIEAMQCGCPVALSDIPALRYSANEAALFFNPYDVDECMNAMKKLLPAPENQLLRESLVHKGFLNARRFLPEAITPQWEALFADLKATGKRKTR